MILVILILPEEANVLAKRVVKNNKYENLLNFIIIDHAFSLSIDVSSLIIQGILENKTFKIK